MNWAELIADLKRAGCTQLVIAQECGVAQSTISDLARGASKEPSFGLGTKLLDMRARHPVPPRPEPATAPSAETAEAGHAG